MASSSGKWYNSQTPRNINSSANEPMQNIFADIVALWGAVFGGTGSIVSSAISAATGTFSGALSALSGAFTNLVTAAGVTNAAGTMFAAFYPSAAAQALSGAGVVNVTSFLTNYTSTGVAEALTLASGTQVGQRKKVYHIVDGGSGVLTAVFVGGTTITFTTVGEFAELIWTGSEWGVLQLGNTTAGGAAPVLA